MITSRSSEALECKNKVDIGIIVDKRTKSNDDGGLTNLYTKGVG